MPLTQTPPPSLPIGPSAGRRFKGYDPESRFDLDPFRGLVCLWIVASHLWVSTLQYLGSRLDVPSLPSVVETWRLGVECFFVLSGFLLAHTLRKEPATVQDFFHLAIRRIVRLVFPYQVALVLAFVTLYVIAAQFTSFTAGTRCLLLGSGR